MSGNLGGPGGNGSCLLAVMNDQQLCVNINTSRATKACNDCCWKLSGSMTDSLCRSSSTVKRN